MICINEPGAVELSIPKSEMGKSLQCFNGQFLRGSLLSGHTGQAKAQVSLPVTSSLSQHTGQLRHQSISHRFCRDFGTFESSLESSSPRAVSVKTFYKVLSRTRLVFCGLKIYFLGVHILVRNCRLFLDNFLPTQLNWSCWFFRVFFGILARVFSRFCLSFELFQELLGIFQKSADIFSFLKIFDVQRRFFSPIFAKLGDLKLNIVLLNSSKLVHT